MRAVCDGVEGRGLRSPDQVMRLDRMGAFHQTRLSFVRAMVRRLSHEGWRIDRPLFNFDAKGVGTGLYIAHGPQHAYTLVCFGHDLPAEQRTDRVIAEAWDATFALYDGIPDAIEIERLRANVPRQEAGRYLSSDLVLARANRSVRLFDEIVACLSQGRQPEPTKIETVGYLMRTTAVYGNGKFGIADRDVYANRPEMKGPFRAEMLTVWLIRAFTVDLVEHMAHLSGGDRAVVVDPPVRRRIGVGNATGLGMAPFLIKHPALIDRWINARETALARVRTIETAAGKTRKVFADTLAAAAAGLAHWTTDDAVQAARLPVLATDLAELRAHVESGALDQPMPWDRLYRWAESRLSLEAQELLVSLLLEPHGALIDDLADTMDVDESAVFRIAGRQSCGQLRAALADGYHWALAIDFDIKEAQARFWYVSEEKLEPRLGERWEEAGSDLEQPLAIARDIGSLYVALEREPSDELLAAFLLRHPEHRHVVRRVQAALHHPYGEVRDNLISSTMRPIDLLRCKLSFFGVTRFDPRSDKWLRITLCQGAPFPDELLNGDDGWIWATSGLSPA